MTIFSKSRALLAAFAACAALAGCTAGTPTTTLPAGGDAQPDVGPARTGPDAAPAPEEPTKERQVARTGSLTLSVSDVIPIGVRLRELAAASDGFISQESLFTGADATTPSVVVLSVPTAKLDATMDAIAALAELRNRSVTAVDLTTVVVDVDARIRTLTDSIERIRELIKRSGSVADIARVESELTSRQSELESLKAQRAALADEVERASITVTLVKPDQVTNPNPLLSGLARGWEAMVQSVVYLIVLVGAAFPFFAAAAVVFVAVRGWRRWASVRRSARAAREEQATTAQPEAGADGDSPAN